MVSICLNPWYIHIDDIIYGQPLMGKMKIWSFYVNFLKTNNAIWEWWRYENNLVNFDALHCSGDYWIPDTECRWKGTKCNEGIKVIFTSIVIVTACFTAKQWTPNWIKDVVLGGRPRPVTISGNQCRATIVTKVQWWQAQDTGRHSLDEGL